MPRGKYPKKRPSDKEVVRMVNELVDETPVRVSLRERAAQAEGYTKGYEARTPEVQMLESRLSAMEQELRNNRMQLLIDFSGIIFGLGVNSAKR